jgi:FAD/FMN-containing dehydrogenase
MRNDVQEHQPVQNRRRLLRQLAAIPFLSLVSPRFGFAESAPTKALELRTNRVRPTDAAWPSAAVWETLKAKVGGRLVTVESPLTVCRLDSSSAACEAVFKALKNPYYIGEDPALTQTSGWVDAWTSMPSSYAIAARTTADVVAGVNFARVNNLRVVVKGGGHSYHGNSNAPDSLLIWTRAMNGITLHDAFVAQGCEAQQPPAHAVTVEAGALWLQVYDAVTTHGGRYVQGGGCATVGVAGFIQGGGFGSLSKQFGTGAGGLLEAEVVTADGEIRIANARMNPDLFWGLKGGGGGSLGVVTRVTLHTHELPNFIGGFFTSVMATSDAAFKRLIAEFLRFYNRSLFNRQWGEQVAFNSSNMLNVRMVFQGMDRQAAEQVWKPFFDFIAESPADFTLDARPITTRLIEAFVRGVSGHGFAMNSGRIVFSLPAQHWWNPEVYFEYLPGVMLTDDRAGAPASNVFYAGNVQEAAWYIHGYESVWLPSALLSDERQQQLTDALFNGSRFEEVTLHFNKGLGGASADAIAAARDTAMNPLVLDAFALAISANFQAPAFPGIAGHEPDLIAARKGAGSIARAMDALRAIVPEVGTYVAESSFFEHSWQTSFWGANYAKLQQVKQHYDPDGLFFVHHGVGSEVWSPDGFTRLPDDHVQ